MKKYVKVLVSVLAVCIILAGCSTSKATSKVKTQKELDTEAVIKVIKDNITATNNEDVEAYLKAITPELREVTKQQIEQLFAAVNFHTSIKDITVESIDEKVATVKFTQNNKYAAGTVDNNGNPISENTAKITDTLEKIDGTWYISDTVVSAN